MMLYIVREDQLSEVVMRKMIAYHSTLNISHIIPLGRYGRGYIQSKINDFNNQNTLPFFILADLDSKECALALIKEWLKRPCRENMVFRIAVREVESWLLADTKGFSQYLKLDHSFIKKEVNTPDMLLNPKEKLISLVKCSGNRILIDDIVREEKASYRQGPGYNRRLTEYVDKYWNIKRAVKLSESFQRAINSLVKFRNYFN